MNKIRDFLLTQRGPVCSQTTRTKRREFSLRTLTTLSLLQNYPKTTGDLERDNVIGQFKEER